MILFRDKEITYLNESFQKEHNELLVVYGQQYTGKKYMLNEYCKGKDTFLFSCSYATERQQQYLWGKQLSQMDFEIEEYPDYNQIFEAILSKQINKTILIIEDFHIAMKQNSSFLDAIIHVLKNKYHVQIILVSSAIGWIENSMVSVIGKNALSISGFLKIRPLPFEALKKYFYNSSVEECIQIYSVLGGYPGLWAHFQTNLSLRENMIRNVLMPNAFLHYEAIHIMQYELRETSCYASILASLAEGKYKLNELHEHTGFSRAKISVYLKNLMELEFVEKVFSVDTEGRANTMKGIYRISDPFIRFYFAMLYPNEVLLRLKTPEEVYIDYLKPFLNRFAEETFEEVCMQYIQQKNEEKKLAIVYERIGKWIGKAGNIPVLAQDDKNKYIVGQCKFTTPNMTYDDYEWLGYLMEQAKITADFIYLFALRGFDEKIKLEARVKGNIKTITVEDL